MLFLRRSIGGEDLEIGEFLLRPGSLPETRKRLQVAVNRLRRSLRFKLEPGWDDVEATR